MALLSLDEEFMKMDEKSLVDFKDIVCSEIISSSEIRGQNIDNTAFVTP